MTFFRNVRFGCVLAACAVSACSQVVPGLNVKAPGSSPSYRVVQITPATLLSTSVSISPNANSELPSTLPSDIPPEYRIGPGDVIYVTVWDHPELTTPSGPVTELSSLAGQSQAQYVQGRLVAADGSIFFPYVGSFKIAGMTTLQARDFIAQNLSRVVNNPQVDTRVIAYRAARVEVTGEVAHPGLLTLDDTPKGVIQAIDLSGGLTPTASRRRATLLRQSKTYEIDLAGLLTGERMVRNPLLVAGDVLHIPDQSADQIFVLGAVAKQAPLVIRQSTVSLIEALTNAGGLEEMRANQGGILVFRRSLEQEATKPTVYTLDLSKPDGMLLASQFALMPRDVVYVQATAFAQYNSVIETLLPTVTTIFELYELTK